MTANQTEVQPSSEKPHPRSVFVTEPGESLTVSWKATNTSTDVTFKDVLIHCFVVAEKEAGQSDVPTLEDPVEESALTMDFKPGGTASGEFSLTIITPGAYLVRVETQNMLDSHGHEHYTALDLVRK